MYNEAWDNSGFIESDSLGQKEDGSEELTMLYTSASGYTRLFCIRQYGRLRVLKALRPEFRGNKLYEHLLQKEFAIGYQLDHPSICRTLGWKYRDDLGHCILLEYIDGITLRTFMDEGRLTPEKTLKILKEIGEALAYMHSKQTVHRDLKPENILITHNGHNAKLIDFSLSDCDDAYLLKIPAGTRRYMAPEVLRPDAVWDARSDLYSLGVIIGEMAGHPGNRHLAAIARRCTRPNREQRYASAEDFLKALETSNRPHARAGKAVLSGLLVLLLGGTGWWGITRTHPAAPAILPMPSAQGHLPLDGNVSRALDRGHDSLQLEQALDRSYPLSIQKESAAYREGQKAVEWLKAHE